jgi:hypothetical protein
LSAIHCLVNAEIAEVGIGRNLSDLATYQALTWSPA